jgi:hypothetical protein
MAERKAVALVPVTQKPDLHASLQRWVADGLLDQDQAERIEALETGAPSPNQQRVTERHNDRSPLAYTIEALGYLGATLTVVASFVTVGELWPDMPVIEQLGLAAAGAVVLAIASYVVPGAGSGVFARLRSILRLLSTACVAMFAGLFGEQVLHLAEDDTFLLTAVAAAAVACGWWLLDKVALQHITMFAALIMTVVAIALAAAPMIPSWWVGTIVWSCSGAWALLAHRGLVPPRRTGLAVAVVGLVAASPVMNRFALGTLLALGTVAVLLAVGIRARQPWLLASGALETFLTVPQAAEQYLPESVAAPLAVFLVGVVLVGIALWLARRYRAADGDPGPRGHSPRVADK